MAVEIYKSDDFGAGVAAGGATGSVKAQHNQEKWHVQLKPSIKSKSFFSIRRRKIGGLDVENFAELIGAKIAYSVMNKEAAALVPEVNFVVDDKTGQVSVISKYLNAVKGSLHKDKDTQLSATKNPSAANEISLEQKKGVCKAIALSILIGDHDINPSNMLKIDENKIARIDYGHAFNDLLSQSKIFGGQVRNKDNQVLDFFNRESVNTIKLGDSTKLWRSYENLIPSIEMSDAMSEMATDAEGKIKAGVDNAKKNFEELLKQPKVNSNHILKSLAAIANNLEGEKIKVNLKNPQETLDKAFNKIEDFSLKQAQNMEKTAELMRAQIDLDEKIKNNKALTTEEIEKFDNMSKDIKFSNGKGKINWIKTSKNEKAFTGTVEEYIKHSAKKLGLSNDKIQNSLSSVPKDPTIMEGLKNLINKISGHKYQAVTTRELVTESPKKTPTTNNSNKNIMVKNEAQIKSIKEALKSNNARPNGPPYNKSRGRANTI